MKFVVVAALLAASPAFSDVVVPPCPENTICTNPVYRTSEHCVANKICPGLWYNAPNGDKMKIKCFVKGQEVPCETFNPTLTGQQ